MEKIGPEPSTKLAAPCDARVGTDWGGYWWSPIGATVAGENGEDRVGARYLFPGLYLPWLCRHSREELGTWKVMA